MEYQLKSMDKFLIFSKINAHSALGRQLSFVGFSYFFYWHDFVIAVHILFFADLCLLLCFFNLLFKGQTKSKWFFHADVSSKKRLYYYDTSGRLVFVCFLEQIEDKNHFGINWPLSAIKESLPGIARLEIACFI